MQDAHTHMHKHRHRHIHTHTLSTKTLFFCLGFCLDLLNVEDRRLGIFGNQPDAHLFTPCNTHKTSIQSKMNNYYGFNNTQDTDHDHPLNTHHCRTCNALTEWRQEEEEEEVLWPWDQRETTTKRLHVLGIQIRQTACFISHCDAHTNTSMHT